MSIATVPQDTDRQFPPPPLAAVPNGRATRRWGAVPGIGLSRRGIQIALAMFWLLDGVLQLQPMMLSPRFAAQILAPTADGQPGWVVARAPPCSPGGGARRAG